MIKNIVKKLLTSIDRMTIKKQSFSLIVHSKTQCAYIDIQTYKGREIQLEDGSVICHGDIVGELHLNNLAMSNMKAMSLGELCRMLKDEVNNMSLEIDNRYSGMKAVYGRSQLFAVLKRIGFEVRPIEDKKLHMFLKIWESLYKWSFSSGKNNQFKIREVKEVWLSADKIRQYQNQAS